MLFYPSRLSDDDMKRRTKLVLVGSCRNSEDDMRVNDLKTFCADQNISENVDFKINVSFQELLSHMEQVCIFWFFKNMMIINTFIAVIDRNTLDGE